MASSGGQALATEECRQSGSKRKRFTMPARVPLVKPCVPRSCDLVVGRRVSLVPPPPEVKQKLGSAELVIGIDVESHDWEDKGGVRVKGRIGRCGFYTLREERDLTFARLVQLGWVVGGSGPEGGLEISKGFLIKPEGFNISTKATAFHGISHQRAQEEGKPLREVMQDFFRDVIRAVERGGRVVAHHLEFDAGIISEELRRSGLAEFQHRWEAIAHKGLCTMDPCIGRWMRLCRGEDAGPATAKNTLCLRDLVEQLVPDHERLLAKHHDAQTDAEMHRLVYVNLLRIWREADAYAAMPS